MIPAKRFYVIGTKFPITQKCDKYKHCIYRIKKIMQKMGLEPTRYCYHRHLKPARLPIPPLLRTTKLF